MKVQKYSKIKVLHPLTFFANVIAACLAILVAFMPFIHEKNFGIVIAIFFGTSFGMQTWFYYIKGLKESSFANQEYISSQKFTSKLLDQYAAFNYKFWGVMKVVTVAWSIFTQNPGGMVVFIFLYNFIAVFLLNMLHNAKKLPLPEGLPTTYHVWKPKKIKIPRYDFANKQGTGSDLIKYE